MDASTSGLAPTELSFISRIRCERTPAVSKSRRAFLRQVAALRKERLRGRRILRTTTPAARAGHSSRYQRVPAAGSHRARGTSRLFSYELVLLEHSPFPGHRRTKVTISIQLPDGTPRYINGYVSHFTQGDPDDRMFTHYRAEVVPWLWFLTRQADCRIFQNMSPAEIHQPGLQFIRLQGFPPPHTARFTSREDYRSRIHSACALSLTSSFSRRRSSWKMDFESVRQFPSGSRRIAIISAATLIAISSGDTAPISKPIGA